MKRTLKSILTTIILVFTVFSYNIKDVDAATGYLSISSSSSVTVGSTISVTVKATGSKLFYWQLYVSYDSSRLKLISGNTTIQGEADDATYGTSSVSRTFKFQALKTGNAYVSVSRGEADMNIDTNFNTISYATSKKTITINPVIPKSTTNSLSTLTIDTANLTPEFNPDVVNYTVELEPNTTEINVGATATDSKASVSGIGKVAVVEGANNLNVVVTAENGATKTYTIVATVKELTPVEVKIGDKAYTVIRKKDMYEPPKNFVEATVKIGEEDVLAYTNEAMLCTVVGLKDTEGAIAKYVYNEKDKTYTPYNDIIIGDFNLYLKDLDSKVAIPSGYVRASLTVDDTVLNAWNYKGNKKFYLIYGVNTINGEESFYQYDKERNTIQRFYNDQVVDMEDQLAVKDKIIIIVSATTALFALTSLVLLIKIIRKKKPEVTTRPLDDFLKNESEPKKDKRKK
ncbi:MAG: cadherin-like beta sandwich domain-containing protein [Bacilli bacterium]|nr:cadherin-like beta sandwich domain-containing protein [Bacilli bacterium]MDD3305354.1 cadherin-like beta sandwich domain-containing protein [Bacilli bacterium]MDD4053372.1 cadherin-like beta sandwich domain-containing protein [Bacilli bacterium]MDD4410981.1 cadherin-like beta sandwich domain-containing protein [Bacilli bacterium]